MPLEQVWRKDIRRWRESEKQEIACGRRGGVRIDKSSQLSMIHALDLQADAGDIHRVGGLGSVGCFAWHLRSCRSRKLNISLSFLPTSFTVCFSFTLFLLANFVLRVAALCSRTHYSCQLESTPSLLFVALFLHCAHMCSLMPLFFSSIC